LAASLFFKTLWTCTSGEQDPDFGVQSGQISFFFGFGLDWISYPIQPARDSDYPNALTPTPVTAVVGTLLAITDQAIELESCWNPLRIQQIF